MELCRAQNGMVKVAAALGIAVLALTACGSGSASDGSTGPAVYTACTGSPLAAKDLLAITTSGTVMAIDPATLHRAYVAIHVLPSGGVAVLPEHDVAYFTSVGADERPAIWAVSTAGCHEQFFQIESDAELPSVSPDGGHLAFVTLDDNGQQTGVGVVGLGATGVPEGAVRRYPASSTPPDLPITGIALGPHNAVLAVWGGFVDNYLGKVHPTVGTLDPATATSLASLTPVFDEEGISIPPPLSTNQKAAEDQKPEDWQSAPTYLPNGEFLVGDGGRSITMPYTDTTPGVSGGGIRTIDPGVGPIESLAAGPDGSIAWVGTDHHLTLATGAIDLPFGPEAETAPRQSPIPTRTLTGSYTSVAWAIPLSEAPPPVAVFHIVGHLPSVVGLSEAKAASTMAALGLPVFVAHSEVTTSVPLGTVLAQDPPAGDGVACQCSVALTIAS